MEHRFVLSTLVLSSLVLLVACGRAHSQSATPSDSEVATQGVKPLAETGKEKLPERCFKAWFEPLFLAAKERERMVKAVVDGVPSDESIVKQIMTRFDEVPDGLTAGEASHCRAKIEQRLRTQVRHYDPIERDAREAMRSCGHQAEKVATGTVSPSGTGNLSICEGRFVIPPDRVSLPHIWLDDDKSNAAIKCLELAVPSGPVEYQLEYQGATGGYSCTVRYKHRNLGWSELIRRGVAEGNEIKVDEVTPSR